jgi:O-antigen ligase
MVHLCGITVFVVLGMMERRPLLMFALAANAGVIMVSNRGGMVAYVVGCAVAWAMRPPEARVGRLAYAFVFFLAVGVVVGPMARIDGGRAISVDQIVLNVKSIFGQGGGSLDGTKKWRMEWWETIWDYTVRGDLFWTGRGFGVNLAKADGFDVNDDLRSPHNGHMTVLARMGVPGLALWALMVAAWMAALFREWVRARRAGRHRWMALFAFLAAYAVAILLNASFDVFLEGPMGGIWFWTVFGLGLAACHLHATRPHTLLDADAPLVDGHRAPAVPVWGWGGGPAAAAGAR